MSAKRKQTTATQGTATLAISAEIVEFAKSGNSAASKLAPNAAIGRHRNPVIGKVARSLDFRGQPLRSYVIPQVLHARSSVVDVNRAFLSLGAEPANLSLFFKDYDYPEKEQVLQELTSMGIRVAPLGAIVSELKRIKTNLMDHPHLKMIGVDDGGYIACATSEESELMCRTKGFLEQTTRGIASLQKKYHDLRRDISRPHLSLPASEIKRTFECGAVGKNVIDALQKHLAQDLTGRKLAVLGADGVIGAAVVHEACRRGMRVSGYDVAPKARYWELNNFGRANICSSKLDAIADADCVIGATGSEVLQPLDLRKLKDGVFLASASSGQYEFPIKFLEQIADSVSPYRVTPDRLAHGTVYHLPWQKSIVLLDGGRPLNLGSAAGPEDACFDLIMALLVAGVAELAIGRYDGATGVLDVFDDICHRHHLAEIYMLLHGAGQ